MAQPTVVGEESRLANGSAGKMVQREGKDEVSEKRASLSPRAAKVKAKKMTPRGLSFQRHFSPRGAEPLDQVTWERQSSVITNPDGSIVFKMEGAEVPSSWSQLATNIVVSKYFRKAGLHGKKENGETSVREVVHRLAHTLRQAGDRFGGYFATVKDADAFEADLTYLLVNQYGAFNSPVWFNCGLHHVYGITGTGGNFAWNEQSSQKLQMKSSKRKRRTKGHSARHASSSRCPTT